MLVAVDDVLYAMIGMDSKLKNTFNSMNISTVFIYYV